MGVGTTERGHFTAWCGGVAVTACAVAALLAPRTAALPLTPLLILAALCVGAEHIVVRHENGAALSGSVVVTLAAVYVFRHDAPYLGPLLVGMAGGLYWPHLRRRDWRLIAFNSGNLGLAAAGAAVGYQVVAGSTSNTGLCVLGAAVAGLANCAVNVAVVGIGLHLRERVSFSALVPVLWGFADLQVFVFAAVGVFLGRLYDAHGAWVFALFVLPILVARHAYAAYLAAQDGREATLDVLIACLEAKDPYTAGHVRRVAQFAEYMGDELGFSRARRRKLRETALLHDIGKLAVPNQLLNKPGRLTPSEYARVHMHESASVELLSAIDTLQPRTRALTYYGLDAVLEARIVHVADAFDAMTSTRAYRRAMSQEHALAELQAHAGTQFDVGCVDALVAALERRGERWGEGVEHSSVAMQFDVAPPTAGAGSAGLGDLAPEPA